jgi:hypothetical protein
MDPISMMNRQQRGPLIKIVAARMRRTRKRGPVLRGGGVSFFS